MTQQPSLFDGFDDPTLKQEQNPLESEPLSKYLPDFQTYISNHPEIFSPIPPSPDTLSQEALAHLPGMSWLSTVQCILKAPISSDPNIQRAELVEFFNQLKHEAIYLNKDHAPSILKDLQAPKPLIALDLETTGLDTRLIFDYNGVIQPKVKIVGICLATSDLKGYYLPVLNTGADGVLNWDYAVAIEFLDQVNEQAITIIHNSQFDREVLALNGVKKLTPHFFDTQIMDYLFDVNNKAHKLKVVSERLLGRKMIELADLFTGRGDIIIFDRLCATDALVYGSSDGINTYGLLRFYLSHPKYNPAQEQPVPLAIDHKISDTIRSMTRLGIPINFRYSLYSALDLIVRHKQLHEATTKFIGREVEFNSPQQLSVLLFEEFNIPPLPNEKRGAPTKKYPQGLYSTKEEVLDSLYEQHPDIPILHYIVTLRKLNNVLAKIFVKILCNAYTDPIFKFLRVKHSYSQTNVPTGRLSSSSSDGREAIHLKESEKTHKITYSYFRGPWESGFNSQGINKQKINLIPCRRIKAIDPSSGVDPKTPYPRWALEELIKHCAENK